MDAVAEIGRNLVSKHQIQPEYGDEQADAGRDCRTRIVRPNSQARTRTGKYKFFLLSRPRAGLATLTRLIHILAICVTTHNIHTCVSGRYAKTYYRVHMCTVLPVVGVGKGGVY